MRKYSCGVPELDSFGGGALYHTTMMMIYGYPGSGKTTLACYCPILSISKSIIEERGSIPDDTVFVVVDCDGGFDHDRFAQIMSSNGLDPDAILQHLMYYQPTDFDDQHRLITKQIQDDIRGKDVRLIAVDAITYIYRGIVMRTAAEYRLSTIGGYTAKLDLQLATIRKLAVENDSVAVITSWPISPVGIAMREQQIRGMVEKGVDRSEAEMLVPRPEAPVIGGRLFGYLPKIIIELRILGGPYREAVLVKHRSQPSGRTARFKLTDKGVEEAR